MTFTKILKIANLAWICVSLPFEYICGHFSGNRKAAILSIVLLALKTDLNNYF